MTRYLLDTNHLSEAVSRVSVVRIWPVDLNISYRYAEVYHELKVAGRALSQVDMMLAAMCRHSNLTLLTTDQDFQALRDIRTEDWVTK